MCKAQLIGASISTCDLVKLYTYPGTFETWKNIEYNTPSVYLSVKLGATELLLKY